MPWELNPSIIIYMFRCNADSHILYFICIVLFCAVSNNHQTFLSFTLKDVRELFSEGLFSDATFGKKFSSVLPNNSILTSKKFEYFHCSVPDLMIRYSDCIVFIQKIRMSTTMSFFEDQK